MARGSGVRVASATSLQIDFRWQGKRYRERVNLPPTPKNIAWCKQLKAAVEHDIAKGRFDYAKHFPDSPRARRIQTPAGTLRVLLRDYCDSLSKRLEPETVEEYRKDSDAFVSGVGDLPTESLTKGRVRAWITASNLSKKRLDNILIPVRGALRQALEDGILETNPLEGFRIRRVEKTKERIDPFTPEEVARLGGTSIGYLWVFWAWTGLRSGELIGLRWDDVDSEGSSVRIRRAVRVGRTKSPKTAAGRRDLYLLPAARAALTSIHRGEMGDSVFTNPNTGACWYEDRAIARAFRLACNAAEVRYRYPYQLRHTFATWALSSGENPAWIAKYMGHADTMMLFRVYGKYLPQLDPEAGSKMTLKAGG